MQTGDRRGERTGIVRGCGKMGRGRSGTVGEDREGPRGNIGSGSGNGRWRGRDVGR